MKRLGINGTRAKRCARCAAPVGEGCLCHACLLREGLEERGLDGVSLSEPAAAVPGGRMVQPALESVPAVDGYRVLAEIGRGGMGVVYLAEQQQPIRRRVALKLIKPGMDTRQVIARFNAERQALALMDHPSVAKVLTAGALPTGRPYFVMELVRGPRITQYCDEFHLSTRERLELFLEVCRAIQHAHQKGIIHRDIKPSNVLVTQQDGKAVPKVIDFGIAKAIAGQCLTDATIATQVEQFLGTPAYTSPEQAAGGRDVDTRTDIYSLGVLLYELLTGQTPFDSNALARSSWEELRRTIRETEPERPSTKLTTLAPEQLREIARRRRTEPPRLIHAMRGDLDWIIMKCLDKEQARRYATCSGVIDDLQRHVQHQPVLARSPSAVYRMQRLVRRHLVGIVAGTITGFALVAGLTVTGWSLIKQKQAQIVLDTLRDGHVRRTKLPPSRPFQSIAPARRGVSVTTRSRAARGDGLSETVEEANQASDATGASAPGITGRTLTSAATPVSVRGTGAGSPGGPARAPESSGAGNASEYVLSRAVFGEQYPEFARLWWKWLMEQPLTNSFGAIHPLYDTPFFNVNEGQAGEIWYLATPFYTVRRTCIIPAGKWIFVGLLNTESSDLEDPEGGFYGATAEEQASVAAFFSDHIRGLFCEIDGVVVPNLESYRFQSRQITFDAPTPWIYGRLGGLGKSSGDGYYLMISPLPPGQHTLHYGGVFQFDAAFDGFDAVFPSDMTYSITIPPY